MPPWRVPRGEAGCARGCPPPSGAGWGRPVVEADLHLGMRAALLPALVTLMLMLAPPPNPPSSCYVILQASGRSLSTISSSGAHAASVIDVIVHMSGQEASSMFRYVP